jgi:hypothetical protein
MWLNRWMDIYPENDKLSFHSCELNRWLGSDFSAASLFDQRLAQWRPADRLRSDVMSYLGTLALFQTCATCKHIVKLRGLGFMNSVSLTTPLKSRITLSHSCIQS